MKLLIVDDDLAVLDAMQEVLREEGYEVSIAADGGQALAQLRAGNRPCLILLDLMMPLMNGWEFRAEQLQDERLALIPTIIITADGRADQKARELKGAGYLSKPIQPELLLSTVEKYCRRTSSQGNAEDS